MNAEAASFFVAGGTVPPGSPSYVERAADRELFEALLAGEFCYVLNSRQMGKSSLAVRTIGRLTEARVRTAFVDLTRIGAAGATPEKWYAGLVVELGRALGMRSQALSALKQEGTPAGKLFGFLADVLNSPDPSGGEGSGVWGSLVVFIDEVDATRTLPFSAADLFAGIRQAWNARASDPAYARLTFCLMGAALPSDLIRDVRMTPFNVGRRVELGDFTPDEAGPFAAVVGEVALARVLHWTGGHPFLTQALCAELARSADAPSAPGLRTPRPPEAVDALVRFRYLDARARDTDSNLADVGNRLLGTGDPNVDEAARAETLTLYERLLKDKPVADDEANPSAARIKMSGVARTENGSLRLRNRLYREAFDAKWVKNNMPGGELRRQRRAFYRGVLRAGLVAAAVLTVVSTLAIIATNNANEATKNAKRARAAERRANEESDRLAKELYVANMGEIDRAWTDGQIDRAAELLKATKGANAGWEWGYWNRRIEGARLRKLPLKGLDFFPSLIAIDKGDRQAVIEDEGILWSVALGSGQSRKLGLTSRSIAPIGCGASVNGRWLVYSPTGKSLVRMEIATGRSLPIGPLNPHEKGKANAGVTLAFGGVSDDGTRFLEARNAYTAGEKSYLVRGTKDGSVVAEQKCADSIVALSPAGETVLVTDRATGRAGASLREIDVATGASRMEYHVDAKPDEGILAGYLPGGRSIWFRSGNRFLTFERGHREPSLVRDDVPRGEEPSFSGDGKTIFLPTQEPGALLIDIASAVAQTLPLSRGFLAPDGRRIWTPEDGLAAYDPDRLAPYASQGRLLAPDSSLLNERFNFGTTLSSRDGNLILFESSLKQVTNQYTNRPLGRATVLAPDGGIVGRFPSKGDAWTPAPATCDGWTLVLVQGVGVEIRSLPDFHFVRRIARVGRFNGTPDWPSTSADGRRTLFVDPSGRLVLVTRKGDGSDESAVLPVGNFVNFAPSISPNGRWAFVRRPEFGKSGDRLVYEAWDLDQRSKRMTLGIGFWEGVWSPDGNGLLTFGIAGQIKAGIRRHDLLKGTTFRLPTALRQGILAAQLSPDGSRLAYATSQGLWLVDAATGRELLQLDRFIAKGFGSPIACLAFASDGRSLVASIADGTFRIYRSDPPPTRTGAR